MGLVVVLVPLAAFCGWDIWQSLTAGPRERWGEVDPEIWQAVELVQTLDGTCDLEDPETRARIDAGASVFHAGAIACLVPEDLFEGGWDRRTNAEKADLLKLLAAHYILSGDERLLDLDICQIQPHPRDMAYFGLSFDMGTISIQPMRYALEQPDPIEAADAQDRFFDCPEWTIEDRLRAED